jgi:hypothetical protein
MPLQTAANFEDYSHDKWETEVRCCQMKLDVLSAIHFIAEASGVITPTTIKNRFEKCGYSNDHVSSNNDNALQLSEDERDDWHSLQPLGVQSEYYPTCGSDLKVCVVQNVNQVLDQYLTRPEEK